MTDERAIPLSDEQVQDRTAMLIKAAESISLELVLQTERLATTIDIFNREVVEPLRRMEGRHNDRH